MPIIRTRKGKGMLFSKRLDRLLELDPSKLRDREGLVMALDEMMSSYSRNTDYDRRSIADQRINTVLDLTRIFQDSEKLGYSFSQEEKDRYFEKPLDHLAQFLIWQSQAGDLDKKRCDFLKSTIKYVIQRCGTRTRKTGILASNHPYQVAKQVAEMGGLYEEIITALLHDIIEDEVPEEAKTDESAYLDWRNKNFLALRSDLSAINLESNSPFSDSEIQEIVDYVDRLTRSPFEKYEDYIRKLDSVTLMFLKIMDRLENITEMEEVRDYGRMESIFMTARDMVRRVFSDGNTKRESARKMAGTAKYAYDFLKHNTPRSAYKYFSGARQPNFDFAWKLPNYAKAFIISRACSEMMDGLDLASENFKILKKSSGALVEATFNRISKDSRIRQRFFPLRKEKEIYRQARDVHRRLGGTDSITEGGMWEQVFNKALSGDREVRKQIQDLYSLNYYAQHVYIETFKETFEKLNAAWQSEGKVEFPIGRKLPENIGQEKARRIRAIEGILFDPTMTPFGLKTEYNRLAGKKGYQLRKIG